MEGSEEKIKENIRVKIMEGSIKRQINPAFTGCCIFKMTHRTLKMCE